MIVIPFKGWHIDEMADYAGQAWMAAHFEDQDPRTLEGLGPAFSGAVCGEIIGCAGLILCHARRAIAWALLSGAASRHVLSIHREVKRFLASQFLAGQALARIEAHVDCDFPAAKRWVEALGFTLECGRMRHFLPDGRDASMWVRFN